MVFLPGFPPLTDLVKFASMVAEDPTMLPFTEIMIRYLGNPLPDFTGLVLFGTTFVMVNKAELLEDFYVKKNMYYSKSWTEIQLNKLFIYNGPFV